MTNNRIWIGGYDDFQHDISDYDALADVGRDPPHDRPAQLDGPPLGQRMGPDAAGRALRRTASTSTDGA